MENQSRLSVRQSENPLFRYLGLRHIVVFLDNEEVADAWTYQGLNALVGALAENDDIDILEEGVPILRAEKSTNLAADMKVVVRAIKDVDSLRRPRGYSFKMCPGCGDPRSHGKFQGPGIPNTLIEWVGEAIITIDMAVQEGTLELNAAIFLLKQVVETDLPLDPPPEPDEDEDVEEKVSAAPTWTGAATLHVSASTVPTDSKPN